MSPPGVTERATPPGRANRGGAAGARGLLDLASNVVEEAGSAVEVVDERATGTALDVELASALRDEAADPVD